MKYKKTFSFSFLNVLLLSVFLFFPASTVQAQATCTVTIGQVYPSAPYTVSISNSGSLEGYKLEDSRQRHVVNISTAPAQQNFGFINDLDIGERIDFFLYNPSGDLMCISNTATVTAQPTSTIAPTVPVRSPTPPDTQIVDEGFLLMINPLTFTGNQSSSVAQNFIAGVANVVRFNSPAAIINVLMPFLFSLAGLILFIMILWGGFEMLYGAADSKAQEAGKQRITAALIGFTLLFISYWIAQIIQYIFGVNILG